MKIKIKEILETRQPYHPPGKNYTSYSFRVNAIDRQQMLYSNIQISTLSKQVADSVQAGEIIEVEQKEINTKNGIMIVYNIQSEGNHQENSQENGKITFEKYRQLVINCYQLAREINQEKEEVFFDKILGCASVMVDRNSIPAAEAQQEIDKKVEDATQKLDEAFSSDDDIPF